MRANQCHSAPAKRRPSEARECDERVPVQRRCGSGGPGIVGADAGVATPGAGRRRRSGCGSRAVRHRRPHGRRPGGPDTRRDTRTGTYTRGVSGVGQAQEGPGAQGCARRRRPARLGHRAPVRPRPRGPLRGDVQAAAGLQPAGRPAHRAGREDERRQGAPERRQGQRRRVRQRDDAGRLHLLRPVRRPRHDARQDPAHPAEAGPAGDGQLRHPEVRPRQRLRQGPHGQPRALRPEQDRIPARQPARRAVRPAPRRCRCGLPRRSPQRREPHRRPAARGVPADAQQADGQRQDLRAGPAAAALDLPVPDRQRLPAAHRRPGRRRTA